MEENMLASCGRCGLSFKEVEINMVDYEIDLCTECEKNYKKKME